MIAAFFSAIIIVGALVLVEVTASIEDAQPVDAVQLELVVDDPQCVVPHQAGAAITRMSGGLANWRYRRRVSLAQLALRLLALAMRTYTCCFTQRAPDDTGR